jgi:outer membrane protein assembly factor BamB
LIHAIDAESGEALWTHTTRGKVDGSPVIAGKRVYVASASGEILGLDLATGQPAWSFDAGSSILASPAIAEGRLVIGTIEGRLFSFGKAE